MNTLVVAAYLPELAGLPASVRQVALGVGAIDAAAGTARALAEHAADRVLLVGTCGALDGSGLAVGDLVVVVDAVWKNDAPGVEVPDAVVSRAYADGALAEALAQACGARKVGAVCPDGVTVSDQRAASLAASTAAVEHMECFAVYRACAGAGVPAAALLAVANRVGQGARSAWRQNARTAEAAAVAALVAFLAGAS